MQNCQEVDDITRANLKPICALNGTVTPCIRSATASSNVLGGGGIIITAPPLGSNHFEMRYQGRDAPAGVTDFVVCRRNKDTDYLLGPDGLRETDDDFIRETRTYFWKENWIAKELVESRATNETTKETRVYSSKDRTKWSVEVSFEGHDATRHEIRLFHPTGQPISVDYSNSGKLSSYSVTGYSCFGLPCFEEFDYPVDVKTYGNAGSDGIWRTYDDELKSDKAHIVKEKNGDLAYSSFSRTLPLSEIIKFYSPASRTTQRWSTRERVDHVSDPFFPGLYLRSDRSLYDTKTSETTLVGYKKYEYQCEP